MRVCSPTGRRLQCAFTLIEVLVVVAIIAVLVAVLLPSLAAARNQSQQAQCGSNLKQAVTGTLTNMLERNMRRERVSTNFGWATFAFRTIQEAGKVFTCPADTNPLPMPPVLVDVYDNKNAYRGRTSSDGVFNKVSSSGLTYYLDIQDSVDGTWFGRDAGTNDHDLLLTYKASKMATAAVVSVNDIESSWKFKVFNHRGQSMWPNPSKTSTPQTLPLMWMSFGANAAAGLRSTKGNPLLIVETRQPGVFPEGYSGARLHDDLRQTLRFRHGPRNPRSTYCDPKDRNYVARQNLNGGYLDGHVEALSYNRITNPSPNSQQVDAKEQLLWHRETWLGIRRGNENWFD